MASTYPTTLDAFSTAHADGVNELIHAVDVNNLADAVNKVEAELGTLPKGTFASVKARLTALHPAVADRQADLGMVASFPPILEAATGSGAPSSGGLEAVGVHLYAGQVVTSIGFCITVVASAITHGWVAVYGSDLALKAQSADTTAPFTSLNWQSIALTSPYTVPTSGLYYLTHMQVATTPATMPRCAAQGAMSTPLPNGLYPWFFQGGLAALPNPCVPASSGNAYVTVAY